MEITWRITNKQQWCCTVLVILLQQKEIKVPEQNKQRVFLLQWLHEFKHKNHNLQNNSMKPIVLYFGVLIVTKVIQESSHNPFPQDNKTKISSSPTILHHS